MLARVIVVDDQTRTHATIGHLIGQAHTVMMYPHGSLAVDYVREQVADVVFVSLDVADVDGLKLIERLSAHPECPPVIGLCREAVPARIVAAVRAGALDVLVHPLTPAAVRAACLQAIASSSPRGPVLNNDDLVNLVGTSPAIQRVRALAGRVARSHAPVLIVGESGVGKELVARAVHSLSRRNGEPFVARNCGAIPEQLFESEMFGTERGAYTGAVRRQGAFELADQGTLFLDEIGELPLLSQVKLLRAMEGSFHRVGGTDERRSAARIIAATNRDLQVALRDGTFREDLYYRVNVLQITIPPLRDRREDIPMLVQYFARHLGGGDDSHLFGADALARLSSHDWRGNVRELRNVVQRALVYAEETPVRSCDIQFS